MILNRFGFHRSIQMETKMHRLFPITLLTVLLLLAVKPMSAMAVNTPFSDDNLIIMDVRYGQYQLGSGIEGYQQEGRTYFALVDLVALIESPIQVDSAGAVGKINDDTEFKLAKTEGSWLLKRGKEEIAVNDDKLVVHDGLIFVDSKTLERWFPLSLKINNSDSILDLSSRGSLPFQKSIERKERYFSKDAPLTEFTNPLADVPYNLWEVPSTDIRLTHITSSNHKTDTDTSRSTHYTLVSNGDMGYMSSNIFINGNREDGVNNVSMRFDRYDTERNIGGPLNLSQVSFGDISAPGALSSYGRGVLVSNESNTSQFSRDFTTIEGNHYPGWEVELYLDDSVIDYQVIGDNGRYYFEDVILSQGDNNYRLVFYGPAGEKEVESRNLYIGEDSEDLRRLRYTASINQPNTRLYSDQESNSTYQTNLTTRFALTNFLSFNAGYSLRQWDKDLLADERILEDDTSDAFYVAGVNAHLLGQSLSVSARKVNDDPFDITYGLGGSRNSFNYRINYTQFGETESGFTYDPLTDVYNVTPESQVNMTLRSRIKGISGVLDARRTNYEGYQLNSGKFILAGRSKGFYWSKGFDYQQFITDGLVEDAIAGNFYAGKSLGPLSARVNLSYLTKPEAELTTIGFSGDLKLSPDVDVSFDFDHAVATSDNIYRLGMKWILPYMTVTPTVSYSDNGTMAGNLTVLMTLGNRTGQFGNYYAAESRTISTRGTLKARLFEDENGDGVYTLGERLLSGGIIHSLQTRQKAASDDVGVATLNNVRAWFPSDIVYEDDTIEEASMKYGGEQFAIEMRPGKVIEVDLPFYRAGDIDGIVYSRRSDGRVREARGITVELVDAKGDVVAKTVSASDGFYSFQRVLPGNYKVIPKGQQTLSSSISEAVITSQGNFIGGYNLVISEGTGLPDSADNKASSNAAGPDQAGVTPGNIPVINPLASR